MSNKPGWLGHRVTVVLPGEGTRVVPTVEEVKAEMRNFFNHFRRNQTPDRFIDSTAEEISLAQASAAKRRAIVQLMDEIVANRTTITRGAIDRGVLTSAQDARAELTERLDRWAGEHEQ